MSRKADNRRKKAEEQASLFDLGLEPVHIRIRKFVAENRRADWREIAFHFNVTVDEVRKSLQPTDTTPPAIPCCEAPYCCNDGRFLIRPPGWEGLRQQGRYYCVAHLPEEHANVRV